MSDPYPDLEPWEAYEEACGRIAYLEAQLTEALKALSAIALYDCSAWAVGGKCGGCPACIADNALGEEIKQ